MFLPFCAIGTTLTEWREYRELDPAQVGALASGRIVVDGRSTGYSRGTTMTELAQLFLDRGATVAYNLDGGGSSAMVFNGSLVNNPLGRGKERGTSDILYLAG